MTEPGAEFWDVLPAQQTSGEWGFYLFAILKDSEEADSISIFYNDDFSKSEKGGRVGQGDSDHTLNDSIRLTGQLRKEYGYKRTSAAEEITEYIKNLKFCNKKEDDVIYGILFFYIRRRWV